MVLATAFSLKRNDMSSLYQAQQAARNQIKTLFAEHPELKDDEQLLLDTIEGSTDFQAVVQKVYNYIVEAEMMAAAIHSRIVKLSDRQKRVAHNGEVGRALLHTLLTEAGVKKIDVVEATIFVGNKPRSVIITDDNLIPDEFIRIKREPDKKAIKAALEDSKTVNGATLSNGGTTIIIRT